jgi:phage shock protein A
MSIWNIFNRGSKIAEAKANSALDKMEDPTEMTSQAIRDLNSKLTNAINAQATYKAMIIQLKVKEKDKENEKVSWLEKASKLQDHIDADPSKTDNIEPLMITALENSKKAGIEADSLNKNIEIQNEKYNKLVVEIKNLRDLINTTEENLVSLRTRQEVAKASVQVNKELSDIAGTDSTKAMIKRMEEKVTQQEALADAYAGIDADSATNESKIDEVLKNETSVSSAELLASFRTNRK